MNITEVKIFKLDGDKTLALANIVIDSDFVVTGLKVVNGQNGLFVAMPSKKNMKEDKTKKYYDIAFPITKEARQTIQDSVLNKYNELTEPHMPIPEKNDRQKEYDNTIDVVEDDLPF